MPPVHTAEAQSVPSTHALPCVHVGAHAGPQVTATFTTFAPLTLPVPLATPQACEGVVGCLVTVTA